MEGYPREFYQDLTHTALPSARRIVPIVRDLITVNSVVDVGCGNGAWLAVFRETGTADVLGIEGDWIDEDQLLIDAGCFRRWSLSASLPVDRRFDLAISLEVAEHLPPERADGFIAELTRLAPAVLFSAAIPNQGGFNHLNEQWPAHWADLFARRAYVPIDTIRWQVWNDPEVTWWYRQNILLFASEGAIAQNERLAAVRRASPPTPLAVVHPEKFEATVRLGEPGFGRWLKMGRAALRRSLARERKHR